MKMFGRPQKIIFTSKARLNSEVYGQASKITPEVFSASTTAIIPAQEKNLEIPFLRTGAEACKKIPKDPPLPNLVMSYDFTPTPKVIYES